jgi:hypothetical protein
MNFLLVSAAPLKIKKEGIIRAFFYKQATPNGVWTQYCQVRGIDYSGVRSSSGAASRDWLSGGAFFQGRAHSDVVAPEDAGPYRDLPFGRGVMMAANPKLR